MILKTTLRYLRALTEIATAEHMLSGLRGIRVATPDVLIATNRRVMAQVTTESNPGNGTFPGPFTFEPLEIYSSSRPDTPVLIDTRNRTMSLHDEKDPVWLSPLSDPFPDWRKVWADAVAGRFEGPPKTDWLYLETEQLGRISQALSPAPGTPCKATWLGEGKPIHLQWENCPHFEMLMANFEIPAEEESDGS